MKRLSPYIFFGFIFFLSGCAMNYYVLSDYEKEIDFSKYQTYLILNTEDGYPVGANPINRQRIERAIDAELQAMGMQQNLHPDVVVAWNISLREVEISERTYEFNIGLNATETLIHHSYLEATLAIDFIDVKNRQVIWHGKTRDQVYEGMPNLEEKINAAVNAILRKYKEDVLPAQPIVMQ